MARAGVAADARRRSWEARRAFRRPSTRKASRRWNVAAQIASVSRVVRPRLLEPDAHPPRVDDLDAGHPGLQGAGRRALVALERELHVGGGDRFAVVELHALAEDELVDEPVLR